MFPTVPKKPILTLTFPPTKGSAVEATAEPVSLLRCGPTPTKDVGDYTDVTTADNAPNSPQEVTLTSRQVSNELPLSCR